MQIDRSLAPMSGNALRGSATLFDTAGPDVAKYAAIGLSGLPRNDADETLCLGGEATTACPRGAEYTACPQSWLLEHRAEGRRRAATPVRREHGPTDRGTCSRQAGTGSAVVQMSVTNELEQRFSTSVQVQRWAEIPLAGSTSSTAICSAATSSRHG